MESSRAEVSIDVWYGYVTFHTKIVYGGCAAWYSNHEIPGGRREDFSAREEIIMLQPGHSQ